jgi:hypothetical protein
MQGLRQINASDEHFLLYLIPGILSKELFAQFQCELKRGARSFGGCHFSSDNYRIIDGIYQLFAELRSRITRCSIFQQSVRCQDNSGSGTDGGVGLTCRFLLLQNGDQDL